VVSGLQTKVSPPRGKEALQLTLMILVAHITSSGERFGVQQLWCR